MKVVRVILLILIVIGLGFLATERLWVPTFVSWILNVDSTSSQSHLSLEQLDNATYNYTKYTNGSNIGNYVGTSGILTPGDKIIFTVENNLIAYGDLNNDGQIDAAVITFYYEQDGTYTSPKKYLLNIAINNNGKVDSGGYTADLAYDADDSTSAVPQSVTIANGIITVNILGAKIPTLSYKFSVNKLILVSH